MDNKYRFLFVDDSNLDNAYVKMMLDIEQIPITTHFSSSGIHALEYLDGLPEDNFPHVIIIDINMPLMNGFEFAAKYKEEYHSAYPETKLFITSSTRRLSEIEKAKNFDVVEDFIEKPISVNHFEEKIFPIITDD